MESQNIQPQNPQDPGSQISEPRRTNRPLLFILPILIAVAIGFGYFIFRDTPPPQITGLEVALKIASFLDTTLQSEGSMLGGYSCDSSTADKCRPVALSAEQPHIGQAIYSYFLLAEASGDRSYREKSDRAINYVLDRCDTDVRMCEWNFFPLVQYYNKTNEDKYLTRGMLRPSEKFLTMTNKDAMEQNVGHKLASLYSATKDVRYRDRLIGIADAELERPLGDQTQVHRDIQVAWSAYIPAYKASGDSKYLMAVEEFFNNLDLPRNLNKFQKLDSVVKASDALIELAEISQTGAYRIQAHAALQEVLFRLWDTPQSLKFNGDYGFIDNMQVFDNVNKAHKPTLFNGWLMKLFVLMGDETFEQPGNK